MKIVYLGVVDDPKNVGNSKAFSVAGNKMQYYLLKYLSQIKGVELEVISLEPHAAFPHEKKIYVPDSKKKLFDNVKVHQVGYVNVPIIKDVLLPIKILLQAKKRVDSNTVLMAFDIYPNQGIALSALRKKVNGKTISILADLSIGGVSKMNFLKKNLRKLYDINTLHNIKKCNHYIVLNKNVINKYAPKSKFLLVDGGIEPSEYSDLIYSWDGKTKNIVYTGALVEYSGIMNLIHAIDYVENTDIVLDIYGDGELKEDILKIEKQSGSRIKYHGRVSNTEAIKAQQTAWLLANPRPVDSLIASVTFPSKIFEYLMSGRPVMSTRLNGFSDDYEDLLYWVEGSDPNELAEKINEVNQVSDKNLVEKAMYAKQYLLRNKTWENNAKKVYDFLRTIER